MHMSARSILISPVSWLARSNAMAPWAKHFVASVLALLFATDFVSGQNCYYPNGDVALSHGM